MDTPKQLGRYTISRSLGRGAMGEVYLGDDPELGRAVAIKTIRRDQLDDEIYDRYVKRFRNEARAAARIAHPNIVQVYDVGEDDSVGPYLVFEYVEGKTLREVVRSDGPLQPNALTALANEIGDALDAAHEAGIVHRDVKPDNILITQSGVAKLADFGVARLPNATLTRDGQYLGTPCYSAPETLQLGEYSAQSDVFSLAAVLFEACTGTRAFPGNDALSVAGRIMNEDAPKPSAVATRRPPPGVDKAIAAGMARDKAQRTETAGQLSAAFVTPYLEAGLSDTQPKVVLQQANSGPSAGFLSLIMLVLFAIGVAAVVVYVDPFGRMEQDDVTLPALDAADAGTDVPSDALSDAFLDAIADGADAYDDTEEDVTSDVASVKPTDEEIADFLREKVGKVDAMGPFEREDLAKEWLTRTETAIENHAWRDAAFALGAARALDPEHPDVTRLANLIEAAVQREERIR